MQHPRSHTWVRPYAVNETVIKNVVSIALTTSDISIPARVNTDVKYAT